MSKRRRQQCKDSYGTGAGQASQSCSCCCALTLHTRRRFHISQRPPSVGRDTRTPKGLTVLAYLAPQSRHGDETLGVRLGSFLGSWKRVNTEGWLQLPTFPSSSVALTINFCVFVLRVPFGTAEKKGVLNAKSAHKTTHCLVGGFFFLVPELQQATQ